MEEPTAKRLILVVEDDPEHAHLIQTVLSENLNQYQIVAIAQGDQALDFLHQQGEYENATRPDLILLNLNLAGKSGVEILSDIKASSKLRRIPIIVLTSSTREEDVVQSYRLQGNCYVIKASELDRFTDIIQRIKEFWLGIVTLPTE